MLGQKMNNHKRTTMKNTVALQEALGDLIVACTTLQSVLIGGINGIEQDRALASFDKRMSTAAQARREQFGDPQELAANPAIDPDGPITGDDKESLSEVQSGNASNVQGVGIGGSPGGMA